MEKADQQAATMRSVSDPELPKPAATPLYPKLEKAEHGRANLDELIRASNLISMALTSAR